MRDRAGFLIAGELFPNAFRFQHAATGSDIDTASLAKGTGKSRLPEDSLKLGPGSAGSTLKSSRWIERDQIDVGIHTFEKTRKAFRGGCRIVFAFDECPFKENAFLGGAAVVAAGIQ
jgi:hypothetical protein